MILKLFKILYLKACNLLLLITYLQQITLCEI